MQAKETLQKMRETMMMHHKSPKTIKSYLRWIVQFMAFTKLRPVGESREDRIIAFLTFLAVKKHVSANTQKQALCAIVYLYKRVLKIDLGDLSSFARSSRPQYLPSVFSREEIQAVLDQLKGASELWGKLMYGCGLRLGEVCSLRVKDLDFDRAQIHIRQAKGNKDRYVSIPAEAKLLLEKQLRIARQEFDKYSNHKVPVAVPDSLDRKYPKIPYEWGWFWLFPATEPVKAREDRQVNPAWIGKLWHLHESAVQKQVGRAISAAGITKKAGCHTFRHSYATHWLESAGSAQEVAIIRLQKLLGHSNPKTTMIYLHTIKQQSDVPSPLDTLPSIQRRAA
jgi:integron integrase